MAKKFSETNAYRDREQANFVGDSNDEVAKRVVSEINANGSHVTVQNPFPTDGDSVYVKDLDLDHCDNYNFSGLITDYFDDLKSVNTDITANNPKQIKLWFNRTIYAHAIGFGCDDLTKGFGTSITIKLLGSGEAVRFSKTFLPSDPNSFLAEFGPKVFNGVLIEFNTVDEICLSNLTIAKASEVSATLNGTDANGDTRQVRVTEDGNLVITDESDGLAIAQGKVTGKDYIHKFGNAPDFDSADGGTQGVTIWDGANDVGIDAMVYTYSTTDDIDSLISTTVGETQNIEIQGLDINYDIVVQTIALTGQVRAALTTPLIRVFRLKNVSPTDIAGFVYCYVDTPTVAGTPTDKTKVRAIINDGNNQTEMALFTIPRLTTGYARSWFASSAGAKKVTNYSIRFKARPFGQCFQLKHRAAVSDGNPYQHEYIEPEKYPAKTDLEMTAKITETGITEGSISAGFDIVLVEN